MRGLSRAEFWLLSFVAVVTSTAHAFAENKPIFWLEPRSNITLDRQVSKEISKRAGLIVLRARWNNPDPDYALKAVVARFKTETSAPVLTYAWANRYSKAGRSEADMLRDFAMGNRSSLATVKGDGGDPVDFLDIREPKVRARVVSQFLRAREVLGVDGFAVDLATRTPMVRPQPLARICQQEEKFCVDYANGMDALFRDLREGLGSKAVIAFNGLFNFAQGQLEDQVKLLESADAAAIEYFGMDPNVEKHSFTENIKPYLDIIPNLPVDRSALVFGRGPWFYTDYVLDYLWQRYLYACFLLAARPNDHFKYHASFQVPAHRGRAGGLDYYADWEIDLGSAHGLARQADGLWIREFANGLVIVAPDDGKGGVIALPKIYFTPEGNRCQERLHLAPGEGAILLNNEQTQLRKPAKHEIDAREMASWRWKGAQLDTLDGREVLRTQAEKQPGEHDVMLDYARSTNPYEQLEIEASLLDHSSAILVVAEVDDPKRLHTNLVMKISIDKVANGEISIEDAIPLRSHGAKSFKENWPVMQLNNDFGNVSISIGRGAFEQIGYKLRRWSHLRLVGSVAVSKIRLSNPTNLSRALDLD